MEARRRRVPPPTIGLRGGDLARTLGGRGGLDVVFPVDLGLVLIDGHLQPFLAHCVVRTRTWSRVVAVGNAQWLGRWNMWPRGHPNDGRLDVVDARLAPRQRLGAWRRLPAGGHVPHPQIRQQRVASAMIDLPRPLEVRCDGEVVGRGRSLVVRVEPDALEVIV